MASIAYVTDQNMIEFHRLNGNHEINFWKPSALKRMTDFDKGDFLFFLAKGTERGRKREKGVVGYGRLHSMHEMNLDQMWNRYRMKNGFCDKESLSEAICKLAKNHQLPDRISCMELKDVVFFQHPIYLSEIGIQISNNIESFFYLDRVNAGTTGRILELANEIGVDLWSTIQKETDKDTDFMEDALLQIAVNTKEKLEAYPYTPYEEQRLHRYMEKLKNEDSDIRSLGRSKTEYYKINHGLLTIYVSCLVNTLDFMKKLQYMIGYVKMYEGYAAKGEGRDRIQVELVFNRKLKKEIAEVLKLIDITYKERLVQED